MGPGFLATQTQFSTPQVELHTCRCIVGDGEELVSSGDHAQGQDTSSQLLLRFYFASTALDLVIVVIKSR